MRQKPLQFCVDHIGAEKVSETGNNPLNHSDALYDRSALELKSLQLVLQLADNGFKVLILDCRGRKGFRTVSFESDGIVCRHDMYLR